MQFLFVVDNLAAILMSEGATYYSKKGGVGIAKKRLRVCVLKRFRNECVFRSSFGNYLPKV